MDIEIEIITVCGDVGADAAISSKGFAACARINPPDPFGGFTGGLAMFWDDVDPAALFNPLILTVELIEAIAIPCSTGDYEIPAPRPVAAGLARAGVEAIGIDEGLPTATSSSRESAARRA